MPANAGNLPSPSHKYTNFGISTLAGESAFDYPEDIVVFLETVLVILIAKQLPVFCSPRFGKARKRIERLARASVRARMPGGPHRDFGVLISDVIDLHRSDPQFMPETDMIAMSLTWSVSRP